MFGRLPEHKDWQGHQLRKANATEAISIPNFVFVFIIFLF
jgi:hypothetical protein